MSEFATAAKGHANIYIEKLYSEFANVAYDEQTSPQLKGHWRDKAFGNHEPLEAMDLEIGTGNGNHFAHLASKHPDRFLVGIELKFKPLVQSIRRAQKAGCKNMSISRFDASLVAQLFAPEELNNVYIHHPDPWPRRRGWKHRLIQDQFLNELYVLQKPGSFVDFKTDSLEYFNWSEEKFEKSKYKITRTTRDLHASNWAGENFITQFEKIFLSKSQPIYYCRLEKTHQ